VSQRTGRPRPVSAFESPFTDHVGGAVVDDDHSIDAEAKFEEWDVSPEVGWETETDAPAQEDWHGVAEEAFEIESNEWEADPVILLEESSRPEVYEELVEIELEEVHERLEELFFSPPLEHESWRETASVEVREVTFPSGQTLQVVPGPVGAGEEHFDPSASGLPLLDISGPNRSMPLSTNFTAGELARSGGKRFDTARIDPNLVALLQAIRDHVGRPVTVTSGYRSYGYNVELYRRRGKEPTASQHSSGRAADITIPGMSGLQIVRAAIDVGGCHLGLGVGRNFGHVDVRGSYARWSYFVGATNRQARRAVDSHRRQRCGDAPTVSRLTNDETVWEGTDPALPLLDELVQLEAGAGTGIADRLRGIAAFVIGPNLRRGAKGPAVAALQRFLSHLGYALVADGDFGRNTEHAVRAFQSAMGLQVDGVAGPQTKQAIAAAVSSQQPASAGRPQEPPAPRSVPPSSSVGLPLPPSEPRVEVPRLPDHNRKLPDVDPNGFAGIPAIRSFAEALAESATRRGSKRTQLTEVGRLEQDFKATMEAANYRFSRPRKGKVPPPREFNPVARAWMFSRREEVDFHTQPHGANMRSPTPSIEQLLKKNAPHDPSKPDRLEELEGRPKDFPVQPLLNRILRELRTRYPDFTVNNYSKNHGGGIFAGRGYSADLYIDGRDERRFFHPDRAVAALLAVNAAAAAVGADWRVLYNDYAVAAALNRHTGGRRVVFSGYPYKSRQNINWHGPDPLLCHFHLDIAPR
jgi:hypothetical protein